MVNTVKDNIDAVVGSLRHRLNLSVLRDRISEHKRGYSFVKDPSTELGSAFLDLANSICAGLEHGLVT